MEGGFIVDDSNDFTTRPPRHDPPRLAPVTESSEQPACLECEKRFPFSFLYSTFGFTVCDDCKDLDDKHRLITRTDAKDEFLLKDCDLDLREPCLRFMRKKNPHNSRWGDMKLYCRPQVEQRALDVWGSMDKLLEARENRQSSRHKLKAKRFQKKLSEMRRAVKSDLASRTARNSAGHVHSFKETNKGNDELTRVCVSCGFKETVELL